jgi:hypothetical protein
MTSINRISFASGWLRNYSAAFILTSLLVSNSPLRAEFGGPEQKVAHILLGLHEKAYRNVIQGHKILVTFTKDDIAGTRFVMRSVVDEKFSDRLDFYVFRKSSCVFEIRGILTWSEGTKLDRELYFPGYTFDFSKFRSFNERSGYKDLLGIDGMCSGTTIYNVFGSCRAKGTLFRTTGITPDTIGRLLPNFLNRYCRSEYTMNPRLESLS